jgi:2-dehydro-3-deoxygluconokinase
MPSLDFLALGEPMVEFNQAPADDARTWLQGFGGDTSNAAIAAARLGVRAGYVTRVGADAFGRWFMDLWQRERVDTRGVREDATAPTAVYFVSHGQAGHEFSYLRAGSAASHLAPDNLPLDVVRDTHILHLSSISQAISPCACDAAFAAMQAAHEAGARVSYDTNLRLKLWPLTRARAVIRESAQYADWMLPSLDDAKHLFGDIAPDLIVDACHTWGAPLVVLKLGPAGCIVSDGRRRERVEGFRVSTVDATGAGDCFDGAFGARLVAGDDAFAAARYANAAAALATTGFGAVAPLPDHAAVQTLLATRAPHPALSPEGERVPDRAGEG